MTIAQGIEKVAGSLNFVVAGNSFKPFWRSTSKQNTSPEVFSKNNFNKNSFNRADLEACSTGSLFGPGSAHLPSGPLLMLDRIIEIRSAGGEYDRGYAIAELDISPSNWFFKHHFEGDPLVPGCLLVESLWQLTGFHMAWSGYMGRGRVLDSGRSRFIESIEKDRKTLTISIHVRKLLTAGNTICIANGEVRFANQLICKSDAIKVGLL